MIIVSLVTAVLALGPGAPKADSGVAKVFIAYCAADPKAGEPYCHEDVSENVKWLVLYSLCTATAADARYGPVCAPFTTDVVEKDEKAERRFLAYSPRVDQWAGVTFNRKKKDGKCEQGVLDDKAWYCRSAGSDWLDIDETGLATVTRSSADDIPIVIAGVNPLLYKTTPESVTSDNIAALDSLQQLALGLGGTLQAAVGIYAKAKTTPSALYMLMSKNQLMDTPPATDEEPEPDALIDVVLLYDQAVAAMAAASRQLGEKAGAANLARSQAIVGIQDIEQSLARAGTGLTVPVSKTDGGAAAYSSLESAYAELDDAYRGVRDFGAPCRPLLNDFLFIVQHASASEAVLRPRIQKYLADHATHAACTDKFAVLAVQINKDAKALDAAGKGTPFANLMKKTAKNYNASLTVIVKPPPKAADADAKDPEPLDEALDILTSRRNDALAAYNGLVTAAARKQDYAFAETTLMTWLYAPPKSDQLPWDKLQTHSFSIKPNAPLASGVTASHPDETTLTYKLQSSKTAGLGVGIGTFYTKLSTPTFDAATDPNNKDQKVVSQTDSSTLAGQLALFADWRAISAFHASAERWVVRPSFQIGTNLSSTPGFFVGGSFDIFKSFRFGAGRTWQQSKGLDASQILDKTVVASKDDIKTRDVFAHDWYYSFTFALDSLPLFKKSDSGGGSTTKKSDDAGDSGTGDAAAGATTAKDKTKKGGG